MATISAFSAQNLPKKMNSYKSHSFTLPPPSISKLPYSFHGFPKFLKLKIIKNSYSHSLTRINSVEEETQIPERKVQEEQEGPQQQDEQQTVSVPVSSSDTLTMFFQAEGTMSESAIPKATNVLKETEGVTGLKVQVLEGIASVELTKQTTVQATGVASSLVELIQGSGFKLQTLNLSFQDEEDIILV